jgi:hypothetical protein
MPFSPEDLQKLKREIEAALCRSGLGAWPRTFLLDLQRKIERYGERTRSVRNNVIVR